MSLHHPSCPLAAPALALAGGIVIFDLTGIGSLWVVAVGVALIAVIFQYRRLSVVALFAAIGIFLGWNSRFRPMPQNLEGRPTLYSGYVIATSDNDSGTTLRLRIDSAENSPITPFNASLIIVRDFSSFSPGQRIRFNAPLSTPTSKTDLPDELDFGELQRRKGIAVTAIIPIDSVLSTNDSPELREKGLRLSIPLKKLLIESGLDDNSIYLLQAMILGDKSSIDDLRRDEYAKSGFAHILALSGLHVAIIAAVIALALFPLYFVRKRKIAYLAIIMALWLFAILTGLAPSVVRAVIMLSLWYLALIIERRNSALNALCLAAILILIFDPRAIFSPGFQLSFAATAGILLFSIPPKSRLTKLLSPFFATLAAVLATEIIIVLHFHTITLWFLPSNLLITLLLTPAIVGGLVLMALTACGISFPLLARLVDFCCTAIDDIAHFFSSLPGADITGVDPGWTTIFLWCLLLPTIALTIRNRRPAYFIATSILTLAIVISALTTTPNYPQDEIYFTSHSTSTNIIVRHADSLLVVTTAPKPRQEHLLHALAEKYDVYMKKRGVNNLSICPDTFSSPLIQRNGELLKIKSKSYLLHSSHSDVPLYSNVDYLIVAKGYRGNIVNLAKNARCDSLLLASDLGPYRIARYSAILSDANIPFRPLSPSE